MCRMSRGISGQVALTIIYVNVAPFEVGCTSNDQCPIDRACVNKQCINPCQCGPNAKCRVENHYAVCSCPEGYSGNPNTGCFQRKGLIISFFLSNLYLTRLELLKLTYY